MPSIENVNDVTPRRQYTASAAQTAFTYPFPIFEDDNLVVDVDGTTQALSTDYTVSGAGDDTGGTVTFVSPMAGGEIVTIYRDIAIERITDFQQNGPNLSRSMNDELDRITLVQQQLALSIRRSLRLSPIDTSDDDDLVLPEAADRAGLYLAFDANGLPQPSAGTGNDSALRTDLAKTVAASDGARLVGFRRNATGSVARSVYDKLEDDVWVNDFSGADPTGTSDSSAAFNNAIAAAITRGAGTVKIRGGKYKVNLDITTSNIKLVGERRAYTSTTVGLYPNNNADWVIDVGSAVASTDDWAIENISIHGHGGGDLGLRIRNCRNWSLRDVDIIGFDVRSMLVTSTVGIGTAYGDLHNVSVAASIAGSVGATFESGTGYCTAIRIANSDFHSTAGTSWALELDNTGGQGVSLYMNGVWIECGHNRGVRFVTTNTELICSGLDIDSSSSTDSLVTVPTNAYVSDYLKGFVRIDGVVTTSGGDTAAVSARWHLPNETLHTNPHVQGSLSFQNSSLTNRETHVSGTQNQRISRAGTGLDLRSTDGDVRLTTAAASAGGGLKLNGAGSVGILRGTGTPEGAVSAPVGTLFLRENGGAGTSLYVKETGAGNTGWVGK